MCSIIEPSCECASILLAKTSRLIDHAASILGPPLPGLLPPRERAAVGQVAGRVDAQLLSRNGSIPLPQELNDVTNVIGVLAHAWNPHRRYYVCRISSVSFGSPNGASASNIGVMALPRLEAYRDFEDAAIADLLSNPGRGGDPPVTIETAHFGEEGYGCILIVRLDGDRIEYVRRMVFAAPVGPITPEVLLHSIVCE